MVDKESPDWRVVIHFEPRSRRQVDGSVYLVFGAEGAVEETDVMAALREIAGSPNGGPPGDEVQNKLVMAVDALTGAEEDNIYLGDLQ